MIRRRALIILACAAALLAARPASADQLEHQLKAAYIYNFIRFVEWPTGNSTGDISVCVAGPASVLADVKEALEEKKVGEREIRVRKTARPTEAGNCDVLYVAESDIESIRRFTTGVPRDRVLTITESEGFPATGSLINFYVEQQSVRFAVNADLLSESRFKLSSQMLQFGTMVSRKSAP